MPLHWEEAIASCLSKKDSINDSIKCSFKKNSVNGNTSFSECHRWFYLFNLQNVCIWSDYRQGMQFIKSRNWILCLELAKFRLTSLLKMHIFPRKTQSVISSAWQKQPATSFKHGNWFFILVAVLMLHVLFHRCWNFQRLKGVKVILEASLHHFPLTFNSFLMLYYARFIFSSPRFASSLSFFPLTL